MKNILLSASAALVALSGAGCGVSTATPDDLASAVVSALSSGDFDGYLADTVMTGEQGLALCPKAEKFVVDVAKFREDFDDCRKKFDFTDATVTRADYKMTTIAANDPECGSAEPVNQASPIEVTVSAGGRAYTFKVEDPVQTLDGWRQTDELHCP